MDLGLFASMYCESPRHARFPDAVFYLFDDVRPAHVENEVWCAGDFLNYMPTLEFVRRVSDQEIQYWLPWVSGFDDRGGADILADLDGIRARAGIDKRALLRHVTHLFHALDISTIHRNIGIAAVLAKFSRNAATAEEHDYYGRSFGVQP